MRGQRGVGLLDLIVGVGILSAFVLMTAFAWSRAPRVHPAALELQSALAEARSVAMAYGEISPGPGVPYSDGATVTITPAQDAPTHASIITVYRSRPLRNTEPLSFDVGFPPRRVDATFSIAPDAAGNGGSEPFSILISNAGYASLRNGWPLPPYPPSPATYSAGEQPCSDEGETIRVTDGTASEAPRFTCREGLYDASGPSS